MMQNVKHDDGGSLHGGMMFTTLAIYKYNTLVDRHIHLLNSILCLYSIVAL